MLVSLSNKAMENVQKEHMTTIHKILPICELAFHLKFLQQVKVHYNMNIDLEMMTKELQLLVSSQVSNK
jgi:hypothetical protein